MTLPPGRGRRSVSSRVRDVPYCVRCGWTQFGVMRDVQPPAFLLTILLSVAACGDSSATGVKPRRGDALPFALTADSGRLRDHQAVGRWRSVVVGGAVREIHEYVLLHRTQLAERRYEFDEQGVLRHFEERMRPLTYIVSDRDRVVDTTRISRNVRLSTIDFLTDAPAFATRRMGERPMGFRKLEMRMLQARGYGLLDSARAGR